LKEDRADDEDPLREDDARPDDDDPFE
jgi:hypothetical protein